MSDPNYNIRIIKAKRSYTMTEMASLLNIDRKTCSRWIKSGRLKVIEKNVNPLLIMGSDLQDFIRERRTKKEMTLKENELFCLGCRKAVIPKTGSEKIVKTGGRIGKDNKEQYKKVGICGTCGRKLNKFLGVYHLD